MDPKTLRFSTTHEWVSLEGDVATVGVSRFAVDQLSDLVAVELPKVGSKVVVGKAFGEVESVKAVSDLYSPVNGQVVAVNSGVAENVELLGGDPYGEGWLIKVKLDPDSPAPALLDLDDYEKLVVADSR